MSDHVLERVDAQPDSFLPRAAYTMSEAAELLSCTRKHLYALMNRGELRSVKLGNSRRVPRAEILRLSGNPPVASLEGGVNTEEVQR